MTFKAARRVRWKNLLCPTCRLWIDRERIVEHSRTPVHVRFAAERESRR